MEMMPVKVAPVGVAMAAAVIKVEAAVANVATVEGRPGTEAAAADGNATAPNPPHERPRRSSEAERRYIVAFIAVAPDATLERRVSMRHERMVRQSAREGAFAIDRLRDRAAQDDRSIAYDRYQPHFLDVFRKFIGSLLSTDEHPAVLEGSWDCDKLVLMSFADEAAFRAWLDSPEYREISKDRNAGAQAVVLLAKGF
jgi:uncharacterized protein (DUF1330 family)